MSKHFFTGLEELEVEKVYNEEKTYMNDSNTDDLEKIVKQNIEDTKEDKDIEPNTDEPAADSDPDLSEAMENYYESIHISMSLENTSIAIEEIPEFIKTGASATGELMKEGAMSAGKGLLAGAVYLKDLGVQYGPDIIKAIGKAALYTIEMILKGLFKGTKALINMSEKSIHSYKSFDSKAEKLKESIAALKKANKTKVTTGNKYTKETIIKHLIIDHKVKPIESIKVYQFFVRDYLMRSSRKIEEVIAGIRILIGKTSYEGYKQPTKYMGEKEASSGLVKKEVSGYEPDSEFVDSYVYPHTLPGNTLLLAYLPKSELTDMEEVYEAYTNSQIFLGKNMKTMSSIPPTEYGTLEEINSLLGEIQLLCKLGMQYAATFKHIEKQRNSIKYSLKGLIDLLLKKKDKHKIDSRMTEAISLKAMFIDKCYIGSMIDVEDYTRLVIRSYIDYCQASLLELSKS